MQRWLKLGLAAIAVMALLAACGGGKEGGTPTDTSIAFFSDRDANPAVYVMKGCGQVVQRVSVRAFSSCDRHARRLEWWV